ncbi:MAG: phosphoglucosamine mutase [Actinomycetota bacterium]
MSRLFGTDGVRGIADEDLTSDLVIALGRAAGEVLAPRGGSVVVGRDTRLSGPRLEDALVAGLCSAGTRVHLAGVLPTPGIAFLTVEEKAEAGAVISASHNPVQDNGIKFFGRDGRKLPAIVESKIESRIESFDAASLPAEQEIGDVDKLPDAADRYVRHASGTIAESLRGLRIVIDCAFGSAWAVAPLAFERAGAEVVALNAEPDGSRINVDCGSTSLEGVAKAVVSEGADFGIAFDGDADRVLAIDERGEEVDGDRILALSAIRMLESGTLHGNLVVATVMSNLGFRRALEARGIELMTVPVGDRFVAEAMSKSSAALGGEQSGHIIFSAHGLTGDGIITGLQVAAAVAASGVPLSALAHIFEPYPQVLLNVPVRSRDALDGCEPVWDAVRRAEETLGDQGRVLLRASGTEPVIRVMVEAADAERADETANSLADVVRAELG